MRIEAIDECAVIVRLSPGDALLLADACRLASRECTEEQRHAEKQLYNLVAAHFDALALIGAAQGLVSNNREFLAAWNLPHVRQGWDILRNEKEAGK